ncbi:MAG: hypothetical protein ACK5MD_10595 [Flavobacteriales bacterium]
MDVENVLTYLGYKEIDFKSQYFRTYTKNQKVLFVYQSSVHDSKRVASVSGEFDGGADDLIMLYYGTDKVYTFNENQRKKLFIDKSPNIEIDYLALLAVPYFNLYSLLCNKGKPYEDERFTNIIEMDNKLHLFFMDEELTKGKDRNILGVLTYDKKTKEESELRFSSFDRALSFSNIMSQPKQAVLFNSIDEMLSFSSKHKEDFLYILIKGSFNANLAKTIRTILKAKSIEKLLFAFPDTLEGHLYDLYCLSHFNNIEIKEKFATLKISIPLIKENEELLNRLKGYASTLSKACNKLSLSSEPLTINIGRDSKENQVFIIEIPKVSNMTKGLLVMIFKFMKFDLPIMLVKSPKIYWNTSTPVKVDRVEKEYKLKLSEFKEMNYQLN